MKPYFYPLIFVAACPVMVASWKGDGGKPSQQKSAPVPVILDTDANNELDDQHAIAYLLLNPGSFDVKGITINRTYNGGPLENHVAEARRVVHLCHRTEEVPVIPGASGNFNEIREHLNDSAFDGRQATQFIMQQALETTGGKLTVVAIGKLTNLALAVTKAPEIIPNIKIIWLGSNWPEPGEYNLENDTLALTTLLAVPGLEIEIVTVRYGKPSGTAAVQISTAEIGRRMPGLGPAVTPITGRYGESFSCFGDYSVELFKKTGDATRALYDLCAVALLKNPAWAAKTAVKGVSFDGHRWGREGDPQRTMVFRENFNKKAILEDLFTTLRRHTPPPSS